MKAKTGKRIVSLLLAFCLVFGLAPSVDYADYADAATARSAIQLGNDFWQSFKANQSTYDYIYYGNYEGDYLKWRLLDTEANIDLPINTQLNMSQTGNDTLCEDGNSSFIPSKEAGLLFMTEYVYGEGESYNPSSTFNWNTSYTKSFCDGMVAGFSASERKAILGTKKAGATWDTDSLYDYEPSAKVKDDAFTSFQKLYVLSTRDVARCCGHTDYYGFGGDLETVYKGGHLEAYDTNGNVKSWLLRSTREGLLGGAFGNTASGENGQVAYYDVQNFKLYARPVMNLFKNNIVMTTPAQGGKQDGVNVTLTQVGTYSGNEWKVTVKDTSRQNFTLLGVDCREGENSYVAGRGETVGIKYSNGWSGSNEYVSTMITDASNNVLYYGRIESGKSSGTAKFKIPDGLADGNYTLKVFSEQCNGDKLTDYASNITSVPIEVSGEAPVQAPVLSVSSVKRTAKTRVSVTYTVDIAGDVYYKLVNDNTSPTASEIKSSGVRMGTCETGTNTSIIYVPNESYVLYMMVEADGLQSNVDNSHGSIARWNELSDGVATRDSLTRATVHFTMSQAGRYYYKVLESGEPAPTAAEVKAGVQFTGTASGGITITVTDLSGEGAKDIYILGSSLAGMETDILKITIPAYQAPAQAPVLSVSSASRTAKTTVSVTYTVDKAGDVYYKLVYDDTHPTASELKSSGTLWGTCETGTNTFTIENVPNERYVLYMMVEADGLQSNLDNSHGYIAIWNELSDGVATRDSLTQATVHFTMSDEGRYYYKVLESGEPAPTAEEVKAGVHQSGTGSGGITITVTDLSGAGAKDIYILGESFAGMETDILKITIPAVQAPVLSVSEVKRTAKTTLSVTYTVDIAGDVYYKLVNDNTNPTASELKSSGTLWGTCEAGTNTFTIENVPNESYYLYMMVETAGLQSNVDNSHGSIGLWNELSDGWARRDSLTMATVHFTMSQPGTYYYKVLESGEPAPTAEEVKAGVHHSGTTSGEITITPANLSWEDAKDIYILGRSVEGMETDILKITIPAYNAADTGIASITLNGSKPSEIGESTITFDLASGQSLPASGGEFSIEVSGGGSHTLPLTKDGGKTWTFTVRAEDGVTTKTWTITVNSADPIPVETFGTFTVVSDKATVSKGEDVTFTVSYQSGENTSSIQFDLDIPEGLTYKSSECDVNGLKTTTGADGEVSFTESGKRFMMTTSALEGLQNISNIELMKFTCTVNDDTAEGDYVIGLVNVELGDSNADPVSAEAIETSWATINVTEQTHPAKPAISVTGTYTYDGSEQTATVTGYDSETMNISGNTGTNAGEYTVSVTSKTGTWADGTTEAVTAAWTIEKATPSYTVPTGLTGTKGDALSTVTLTSGWTWKTPDTVMETAGEQTFTAVFTPDDTANYTTVEADVTVTVTEPAIGVTVSGTVTSFQSETENVTVQLFADGQSEAAYTEVVTGNSASYSIANVAAGTYTMKVSKANHVTREYTVTVDADNLTQDAKIQLLGDVNGDGKISMVDAGRANAHAKGASILTGYELNCADTVKQDGLVTFADAARINAHAKGTTLLW